MPKRKVQERIIGKLAEALDLQHLEVVNESGNHNVPAGSESHFKVVLVSENFEGLLRADQSVVGMRGCGSEIIYR